ncbi:ABC transporter permease [Halomonas elongata]|uniref:ABC transporter permease subunit n=1 Tax=Halomonas elongata (strain ATCC 33173 / DSM 2581 / NBRC 15536 / NCIMB 2198 / 1H9) TaxID=768066 RepID=E1V7U7_HALED|nr:ABC transporter permease subunit [Halomonas elongata]WBF17279.1 ABC transporter permease subunit [Halomonas elongata]WPU46116.1 ABC transporter permease subunit [Halomonas elongata DSM 2581]CBV43535.1 ABC-type transport system permease protein YnjC [Halomonas elongata DSM 2581]
MPSFVTAIRAAPAMTLALLILPVLLGLAGVIAPAFGWHPALGGETWTLNHWRALGDTPGLVEMGRLSLFTGIASALAAFVSVALCLATFLETRFFGTIRRLLSPLLAVPHAAAAIGLAFLLTPSGLASRLVSPWLSGWSQPPDYLFPGDEAGLALILGLTLKEIPFLLLMSLAALPQCRAGERLMMARALGYGRLNGFLKGVMPALYPLIRLPLYAVIVFATANIEVAMILGPSTPPTLAVAVVRWLGDPDLTMRFQAAAGALLQIGVTAAALLIWWLGERLVSRLGAAWLRDGHRRRGEYLGRSLGGLVTWLAIGVLLAALAGLILWSLAGYWPFPDAWPATPTLHAWRQATMGLGASLSSTVTIGLAATGIALALTLGCLEAETHRRRPLGAGAQLILYLPLLVPQVAFLQGLVQWQAQMGLAPGWPVVTLGHVLFVLPYTFLSLAESYRRQDPRWRQVAATLGASPASIFLRVRLPMLAAPILVAGAVGFAVSVGQYLPTLLLGAGRLTTLTTEAVNLASGGDRRLTAVYALYQLALPALGFLLATALPRLWWRDRRQMLSGDAA